MNVLIISETYPPVLRASARIMKDLALIFKENSHNVSVLTFVENSQKYKELNEGLISEDGVDVLRIKTLPQRGVSYFRRGIAELTMPFFAMNKINQSFKNQKFDLIIAHIPPISLYPLLKMLKKKNNAPLYLVLRDIHPQTGVDLGVFKENGIVHKYFRFVEKKLYKTADIVAAQSPKNMEIVVNANKDLDKNKFTYLFNWKTAASSISFKTNFREKFNLKDKVIALYGGNMTSSQDLKELIVTAEKCLHLKSLVFLVVGFGKEREKLEKESAEKGLFNIVFKDPLSLNDFTELVYQCDIGLIYLNKKFTTHNFPGKMLDYMDASLPIVASVNNGNDIAFMIEKDAECGFVHFEGDFDGMSKSIEKLVSDEELRKKMGANGRRFLEKELNAQNAYNKIISDINKLNFGGKNA